MSLAVRMVGLNARKEISSLDVKRLIGNRCEVIQKRCFERVKDVVSESDIRTSVRSVQLLMGSRN